MTTLQLLLTLLMPPDESCMATQFGAEHDRLAGGNALYLKRPVNDEDLGIAHRTLPLGAVVMVQDVKTHDVAIARVIDRGPYGATDNGQWVLKRYRKDPGVWRGCVDLTPALGEAIGHDGLSRIHLWVLEY